MLLVGNGRVITRDENNPYFQAGAVAIDGEKIVAVGGEADLKEQYPGAEFVDAQGGIIMPGLVNAHTHIYSGLARGLAIKGCDPKNFLDNLEIQWWKIDRNLDLDATRAQVRCRRRSYLRRHGAWRGRCLSGRRAVVFNIIAICFKVAERYAPASIFTGCRGVPHIAPDDTFQHPASY